MKTPTTNRLKYGSRQFVCAHEEVVLLLRGNHVGESVLSGVAAGGSKETK